MKIMHEIDDLSPEHDFQIAMLLSQNKNNDRDHNDKGKKY